MYLPTIAEQLRLRGHDVVAVTESSELRSLPDAAVFAAAQRDSRAVATENVADFIPLANEPDQCGESHCGLVLVDPSRFSPGVSLKNDPRIPPNTPPPAATKPKRCDTAATTNSCKPPSNPKSSKAPSPFHDSSERPAAANCAWSTTSATEPLRRSPWAPCRHTGVEI